MNTNAKLNTRMNTNAEAMIDREHTTCRDLYLDLLKKCLINSIYEDTPAPIFIDGKSTSRTRVKDGLPVVIYRDGQMLCVKPEDLGF